MSVAESVGQSSTRFEAKHQRASIRSKQKPRKLGRKHHETHASDIVGSYNPMNEKARGEKIMTPARDSKSASVRSSQKTLESRTSEIHGASNRGGVGASCCRMPISVWLLLIALALILGASGLYYTIAKRANEAHQAWPSTPNERRRRTNRTGAMIRYRCDITEQVASSTAKRFMIPRDRMLLASQTLKNKLAMRQPNFARRTPTYVSWVVTLPHISHTYTIFTRYVAGIFCLHVADASISAASDLQNQGAHSRCGFACGHVHCRCWHGLCRDVIFGARRQSHRCAKWSLHVHILGVLLLLRSHHYHCVLDAYGCTAYQSP